MTTPDERLLTPAGVAGEFRVTVKAVHKWVARGWLPVVDTPQGRRFRPADVDALKAATDTRQGTP